MNDNLPTNPPLEGARLEQAIQEMQDPAFFMRLGVILKTQADRTGLLRGNDMLPGGNDCTALGCKIAADVCNGIRQWKASDATFFKACTSAARSAVNNLQTKAANFFEWQKFDAADELWSENTKEFPASPLASPAEKIIQMETLNEESERLFELLGVVEPGTLDARMVEALIEDPEIRDRAEVLERIGCNGAEYDAAIKRIKRYGQKIIAKKEQIK